MPQPKLLSKPWASDGLKNNIPAERNGGLAQEAATYAEGFPSITMTPISVGGKPPSGKDMNGVLYEISAHTVWQNQGGRYRFDQAFCDTIGGYPKGAVLINDTLDTEYISLVDANTHNPNSGNNTGKWAIHAGKGLKAGTTQAGIVQLSSATDSNSEELAATPKAVKAAYDKAVAAKEAADGAVKTTASQEIGGDKTFTAAATFKAGAFVADSVGDFNANQYLQIGSNNVNSYLHNKKSNKFLSMRNDGELRYDGKRVAMLPDLSNVSRRDYSREQTPVNPAYASERYKTEGSVSVYPDGRIVQTFWLKVVAHTFWLPEELPGFQVASANDVSVALSLWTAMPNKVTNVQVQPLRCSDPNKSTHYYAEAAELSAAWALRKQKGNKNTVWLDIGRIAGSMGNDRIDIFVNVEGY